MGLRGFGLRSRKHESRGQHSHLPVESGQAPFHNIPAISTPLI